MKHYMSYILWPLVLFNLFKPVGDSDANLKYPLCESIISFASCSLCSIIKANNYRILGGSSAEKNEFLWMIAIVRDNDVRCGATLITDRHVLTAAHCFNGFEDKNSWNRLKIYVGLHNMHLAESRKVDRITIHPDYNARVFGNDIAIVQLDQPMFSNFIHPICLPCGHLDFTDLNAIILEWEETSENGVTAKTLKKVVVPVVPQDMCFNAFSDFDNSTMFCAGEKDACQGDTGDPVAWRSYSGVWHLFGIVSFGDGCARPNTYDIYGRVQSFLKWIEENTATSQC